MANQKHVELLKQGSDAWNTWRKQHSYEKPDLYGADLYGTGLYGANLSQANLSQANLTQANLTRADLTGADLYGASLTGTLLLTGGNFITGIVFTEANLAGANLTEANLAGANLTEANLAGANLTEANLYGANLTRADLTGANLNNAHIWLTTFANVDLSTVKGLETVRHDGPSSIGIETIYRSQGKIPERFLRDAGVPDSFLEYMHSLVGQAIRYFTCFISHSHHDQRFCDRLYADLRHHDVPSWYFPEDATWGKTIWGEIDRSIKIYDKLVVVCSEHSLQSPAVQREIERALQREDREGKNFLFPIRIDNYLFQTWEHERKADVVNKIAADFRGWESSAEKYDKAFQRFLTALKAEDTKNA